MIFHTPSKMVPSFVLTMEDTDIEKVSNFSFVDLTINEHLNWKSHIDNISNKISKNIGIINKIKTFFTS